MLFVQFCDTMEKIKNLKILIKTCTNGSSELMTNLSSSISQLIDEVVEERNQEIHERFKEKSEKYISE